MGWTAADVRKSGRPMPRDSPKPHKYNARKKEVDGILFDSTREAKRYLELKVFLSAGCISDLKLQPQFLLQERVRDSAGRWVRPIWYVADFDYFNEGERVVEDVKGYRTPVYRLKVKLFRAKYPHVRFIET